jgi:hypothetical protein
LVASAGLKHALDDLDGLLDLFVGHRLDDVPAVLQLQFARHQKRKNFEVRGRLVTSDLLDRLLAFVTEVQQQRLHELLVQQVTCTMPVATRVSRNPLLEGHLGLHVHRVVLNVNKCLMGLQNTFAASGDAPSQISVLGLWVSTPFKPSSGRW